MKFKETMAQLKIDMKPMTFAQKADHIWSNFKEYILVVSVIAILAIGYIVTLVTAKDSALAGYTINVELSQAGEQYITQAFLPAVGDPEKEEIVVVYREYAEDPKSDQVEGNYMVVNQLGAMVNANELDYVISDKAGMELCLALDVYLELTDFLTADELAAMEGKIIYGIRDESDVAIPLALDITDTAFAKEYLKTRHKDDKVYIGFIANTLHPESCRSFWDFINQ